MLCRGGFRGLRIGQRPDGEQYHEDRTQRCHDLVTAHLHARILEAHRSTTAALLSQLSLAGYWTGELSSSALSTATAVIALATVDRPGNDCFIRPGLRWLVIRSWSSMS